MPDIRSQLEDLLSRRILILDGAMGTMLQARDLAEADFRGERFADHPSGKNLFLSAPLPYLPLYGAMYS